MRKVGLSVVFAVQCCIMNDVYGWDPQMLTQHRVRWKRAILTSFFILDIGFLWIKSGFNQSTLMQQFAIHFFILLMILLPCISAIIWCPYVSSNNSLGGSWMLQQLYEHPSSSLLNNFILSNLSFGCQWPGAHLWIEDAHGPSFVWLLALVHSILSSRCSLVFP